MTGVGNATGGDIPVAAQRFALLPGDLLIVEGTAPVSKVIEVGAVIEGEAVASHVALFHHSDFSGPVPAHWGIEGRPGGVGWVDLGAYLRDPRTVSTAGQPKTDAQRGALCKLGVTLLGTPYDWVGGIAADGATVLHLAPMAKALHDLGLWRPAHPGGLVPGHVVCSSAWAWAHDRIGLPSPDRPSGGPGAPDTWEPVTPANWKTFAEARDWERPA
jgi:hypothetical protein